MRKNFPSLLTPRGRHLFMTDNKNLDENSLNTLDESYRTSNEGDSDRSDFFWDAREVTDDKMSEIPDNVAAYINSAVEKTTSKINEKLEEFKTQIVQPISDYAVETDNRLNRYANEFDAELRRARFADLAIFHRLTNSSKNLMLLKVPRRKQGDDPDMEYVLSRLKSLVNVREKLGHDIDEFHITHVFRIELANATKPRGYEPKYFGYDKIRVTFYHGQLRDFFLRAAFQTNDRTVVPEMSKEECQFNDYLYEQKHRLNSDKTQGYWWFVRNMELKRGGRKGENAKYDYSKNKPRRRQVRENYTPGFADGNVGMDFGMDPETIDVNDEEDEQEMMVVPTSPKTNGDNDRAGGSGSNGGSSNGSAPPASGQNGNHEQNNGGSSTGGSKTSGGTGSGDTNAKTNKNASFNKRWKPIGLSNLIRNEKRRPPPAGNNISFSKKNNDSACSANRDGPRTMDKARTPPPKKQRGRDNVSNEPNGTKRRTANSIPMYESTPNSRHKNPSIRHRARDVDGQLTGTKRKQLSPEDQRQIQMESKVDELIKRRENGDKNQQTKSSTNIKPRTRTRRSLRIVQQLQNSTDKSRESILLNDVQRNGSHDYVFSDDDNALITTTHGTDDSVGDVLDGSDLPEGISALSISCDNNSAIIDDPLEISEIENAQLQRRQRLDPEGANEENYEGVDFKLNIFANILGKDAISPGELYNQILEKRNYILQADCTHKYGMFRQIVHDYFLLNFLFQKCEETNLKKKLEEQCKELMPSMEKLAGKFEINTDGISVDFIQRKAHDIGYGMDVPSYFTTMLFGGVYTQRYNEILATAKSEEERSQLKARLREGLNQTISIANDGSFIQD